MTTNELAAIEAILETEGLRRSPDDEERIWYRPDPPGMPQPEITEYGRTADALKRVLGEARGEAAMAWAEVTRLSRLQTEARS